MGLQRQFPGNIVLEAAYVGMKGKRLYYGGAESFNHLPEIAGASQSQITALNQKVANPFNGIIKTGALSGPEVSAFQLQLPYPQFIGFSIDSLPVANSIYHSFQLRVEKRLFHGLQFMVAYTLSKSIDDASVQGLTTFLGGSSSLQDPNNRRLERSLSQFDATHVLNVTYVWDISIGRGQLIGRNWNPWVNGILGGWKTNAIWQFSSGLPLGLSRANLRGPATESTRHAEKGRWWGRPMGEPVLRQSRSRGGAAAICSGLRGRYPISESPESLLRNFPSSRNFRWVGSERE